MADPRVTADRTHGSTTVVVVVSIVVVLGIVTGLVIWRMAPTSDSVTANASPAPSATVQQSPIPTADERAAAPPSSPSPADPTPPSTATDGPESIGPSTPRPLSGDLVQFISPNTGPHFAAALAQDSSVVGFVALAQSEDLTCFAGVVTGSQLTGVAMTPSYDGSAEGTPITWQASGSGSTFTLIKAGSVTGFIPATQADINALTGDPSGMATRRLLDTCRRSLAAS